MAEMQFKKERNSNLDCVQRAAVNPMTEGGGGQGYLISANRSHKGGGEGKNFKSSFLQILIYCRQHIGLSLGKISKRFIN